MSKETKCRYCGLTLRRTTSGACNPDTGEEAKQNYYGGWVCSRHCDYNEAGSTNHPSTFAQKQIDND